MPNLLRAAFAIALLLPSFAVAQSVEHGKFGRALKVGQTYAAADHNPIYIVTPLTVELWARINGKFDASILLANEPRNSRTHWELFTEKETGRFAVGMQGFNPPQVVSQADIVDDQWHYLAFIFDGETVKLFVDGKEVAKAAAKRVKPYPDTGPLNFGFQLGFAPHPDTMIDEVRISRMAREIKEIPAGPFQADIVTIGLWHFDEDAKAIEKGGFADASLTRNPAQLRTVAEGVANNGGFDNTVGGKTRWQDMDFGPFFSSTIYPPGDKTNVTHKGISIQLGKDRKHFVTFDTELLRMSAAWEGSFIKLPAGREGLSGPPEMGAKPFLQSAVRPGWIARLTDPREAEDPRPTHLGPLPQARGHYQGLYTSGDSVAVSYAIGDIGHGVTQILETFDVATAEEDVAVRRTIQVGVSTQHLSLYVGDLGKNEKVGVFQAPRGMEDVGMPTGHAQQAGVTTAIAIIGAIPQMVTREWDGHHYLTIPPHAEPITFRVAVVRFKSGKLGSLGALTSGAIADLRRFTKGGASRYPNPLATKGTLGKSDGPYAVDTLVAPDDNPWHSFLRFGGHDFFKNGDCAIGSVSGDVWVVSGIDDKLENLKWRRFATGLFQPLGLKIVDDKVYVLGRDQITRLHDLNGDGEADFYENFNNDGIVTTAGHAYVTCLERDAAGNFYYIKCGDRTAHGGSVLRVSPDGKNLDVAATGVRNANGLGVSPDGVVSFADNQGDWVPASRIDLITKPMQFLGYTPMAKTPAPPTHPGYPIIWMPQNVDNSSGGQVWVQGDKWGLPAGTMLHTSYGAAALLQVMPENVKLPSGEEVTQAGVWRFPAVFSTGIMRGRFREKDGQLYVCGLRGWQTAGTKDGALQRVRYTGKPMHAPTELHVHENAIRLRFTDALDKETASDPGSWSVLQWNYHWSSEYGSKHWSVLNPDKQGYDTLEVKKATLLADGKTVFLEIPGLKPVMQMRISCNLDAKDGTRIKTDVYNTIHALGPAFSPGNAK
jgi:hypothetical protein